MEAAQWQNMKSVLPYADANLDQVRTTLKRIRGKIRGEKKKAG
jgi:hypothetical protein